MNSELRPGAGGAGGSGGRPPPMAALSEHAAFRPPTLLFLLWSLLFFSGALFPDFFLRETVLFALYGCYNVFLSVFPRVSVSAVFNVRMDASSSRIYKIKRVWLTKWSLRIVRFNYLHTLSL